MAALVSHPVLPVKEAVSYLVVVGGNQEHILALIVRGTDVAILCGSLAWSDSP